MQGLIISVVKVVKEISFGWEWEMGDVLLAEGGGDT